MDQITQREAVEGLRKMMVVFSKADSIAKALEQFASAEAAAAGWLAKVKAAQDELDLNTRKLAVIAAQHDAEVTLVAKDALALQAKVNTDIAAKNKQLAELGTQTSTAQQQLADINVKIKIAEQHRAKLMASLS